jgi:hypothetical protein
MGGSRNHQRRLPGAGRQAVDGGHNMDREFPDERLGSLTGTLPGPPAGSIHTRRSPVVKKNMANLDRSTGRQFGCPCARPDARVRETAMSGHS